MVDAIFSKNFVSSFHTASGDGLEGFRDILVDSKAQTDVVQHQIFMIFLIDRNQLSW